MLFGVPDRQRQKGVEHRLAQPLALDGHPQVELRRAGHMEALQEISGVERHGRLHLQDICLLVPRPLEQGIELRNVKPLRFRTQGYGIARDHEMIPDQFAKIR